VLEKNKQIKAAKVSKKASKAGTDAEPDDHRAHAKQRARRFYSELVRSRTLGDESTLVGPNPAVLTLLNTDVSRVYFF